MSDDVHRVADVDDLAEDGSRVVAQVDGWEVAVFNLDGDYHALANYCIHEAGPLCEGDLTGVMDRDDEAGEWQYDDDDRCVVCPWHGWRFDVRSGVSVDDDQYAVPTYDVEARDGGVYVRL